jgi:hypothetical protein
MRKRIVFLITSVLFSVSVFSADKVIPFEQLPKNAQEFTRKYFSAEDPMYKQAYVTYDAEFFDSSYTVVFTTGDGLEFNKNGEWKDFDCKRCAVPDEIIPATIKAYLSTYAPEIQVKKIEKNRRDYEIKLSSGLELKFDLEGNLIEIDN